MSASAPRLRATTSSHVHVVGIGADGWSGLPPEARDLVAGAALVFGAERHLAMLPSLGAECKPWRRPLSASLHDVRWALDRNIGRVVVLATGDPLDQGIGRLLTTTFGRDRVTVHPQPGAFALACAALGWAREDTKCLSLHGRPKEIVRRHLWPGRQILCLTDHLSAAGELARCLCEIGWGASELWQLQNLGASDAARHKGIASQWQGLPSAELETVAIRAWHDRDDALAAGFPPDSAFEHDGQLSKAPARALAMAALNPQAGQHLWDLGAGCGGTSITWLRLAGRGRVTAVERKPPRADFLRRNGLRLGTPEITVITETITAAIDDLAPPDAVFVGGGCGDGPMLRRALESLPTGAPLVAQAVTLEGQRELERLVAEAGGELQRLHVEMAAPLGGASIWRPSLPLVQAKVVAR